MNYKCEKCGQVCDSWSSAYLLVHSCSGGEWRPYYKKEYEQEKRDFGDEVFKINRRKLIYDITPPTN